MKNCECELCGKEWPHRIPAGYNQIKRDDKILHVCKECYREEWRLKTGWKRTEEGWGKDE